MPGTIAEHVQYDTLTLAQQQRYTQLIAAFGLQDIVDREILDDLSEGEKKKVQVILTRLKEADHYIFDEPLAHVDSARKAVIMEHIFTILYDKTNHYDYAWRRAIPYTL